MALTGVIVLSSLFAITHILMSHGSIRSGMVDKHGELKFRGIYSAVSFITLGGAIACFVYAKGQGGILWDLPRISYLLAYPLNLMAFTLILMALANPSPAGMMPGQIKARGVLKITRHPMNMGMALWGLAHVIANGYPADIFFFGSIFVTGFLGAIHQDGRKMDELGEDYKAFMAETSVIPFLAMLTGKTWPERDEIKFSLIGFGFLVFAGVVLIHGWLFGVAPW
jgi:uncharacterized membrane protein